METNNSGSSGRLLCKFVLICSWAKSLIDSSWVYYYVYSSQDFNDQLVWGLMFVVKAVS